jgi:hypothetical protein
MNEVTLTDVGLHVYDLSTIKDSVCMSICSTRNFDISLFIIPAGLAMPLHDHPDMAVLTKLLCGEALCTSFTPLYPRDSAALQQPQQQQHQQQEDTDDTPPSTPAPGPFFSRLVQAKSAHSPCWHLSPSRGNIHAIHALAPPSPPSTDTDTAATDTATAAATAAAARAEPVIMLDVLLPPYDPSGARPCTYYSPTAHPLWVPTVPVGLRQRGTTSSSSSSSSGEETEAEAGGETETGGVGEEWLWKKWVLEEVPEPTESLPYAVQYSGDTPVVP